MNMPIPPRDRRPLFGWIVGILLLLVFPLFLNTYLVLLLTEIMIMGIFALSFNLLFGYTGLLSFGHAAFFGVGGYITAFLLVHEVPSLIFVLAVSVLAAVLSAMIIGFFAVRLDEIYFAILTLGFGMMFYSLAHQWRSVTGGSDGLTGLVIPQLGWHTIKIDIASPRAYYYVVALFFLLVVWLLLRLTRSAFGLILLSIRENKERAAFTGVNIRGYRLACFVIAGGFAGLAGGLFAVFDRMASPSMGYTSRTPLAKSPVPSAMMR